MPMVDIDWLSEHVVVPQDYSYEQLAADLVRVGLEEEEIHRSQVTGPVVVGYVVDATPEPQKNGKIINWCHVDVGSYNTVDDEGNLVPRGIVCGAPNMRAGEKVVVTLPGAVLPGDFKIEPRKTYGHISDGMCASERELGLGDAHEGIILLSERGYTQEEYDALQPGQDALSLLHLDQPTLEINITPDRGYAFSYRGVAREFHHSTGADFTDPVIALQEKVPTVDGRGVPLEGEVAVEVEDANPIHGVQGCDRFYARIIRNVDPTVSSPNWMQRRLIRAGMRSISLPVDVTNYIMLDLGQPLHAYDLDKLELPIVVRRARAGETLVTLDGKSHDLNEEDLLITDSPDGNRGSRVLGIAGVMGGLYGEVTAETTNILIEAAHFDPITIARSARRHKIPSEASRRFERGVDTQIQPAAAQMAADLLEQYGHGKPSSQPTDFNHVVLPQDIRFAVNEVERIAGIAPSAEKISEILSAIGCRVAGGGNGELTVTPPTWRPDITQPCDLVEEIARLIGYDEIPVRVPDAPALPVQGLTLHERRRRAIADTLANDGFVETLSYPFVGKEDFDTFRLDAADVTARSVEIANPLAGNRPYLRRTLLLTIAATAQRNIRRGMENVAIFEMGHVFFTKDNAPAIPALPGAVRPSDEDIALQNAGLPEQPLHVAGVLAGNAIDSGWLGEKRAVDWSDAVAAVRRIADRLNVPFDVVAPYDESGTYMADAYWHPGRVAQFVINGVIVGFAGELHPRVNEALGFPAHSAAFELDITTLLDELHTTPVQAKPISTYPVVRQDFAFTVKKSVASHDIMEAIRRAAQGTVETIQLFDVYMGNQLNDDEKSLAFAVTFRAMDKTLTPEDCEQIRARIVAEAEKLGAMLRA